MLFMNDTPVRCFSCKWRQKDVRDHGVTVGDPAGQTFYEILAVVLAIELWCTDPTPTVVLGDNTASLQETLDMRGKGAHACLSQVLAVLRCSRTLHIAVGHLPTESNLPADALSRQAEPGNSKPWPFASGTPVSVDVPLRPSALWEIIA